MTIQISLSDPNQAALVHQLMDHLYNEAQLDVLADEPLIITSFVEGCGLACPMPLLKTKMALRSMAVGESVYVTATDPNSQMDLMAFCQQSGLDMRLQAKTDQQVNDSVINRSNDSKLHGWQRFDTIFHVIITKTHGN